LNIAILGTRGVPPRYGGFETFAAELGTRLVARGHRVTVYSREPGAEDYNGIARIVLPFVPGKYFETVTHSLLSAIDALRRDFDVVLVCNAANAFVIPLLRAARTRVAINVDGIERRRRKWNVLGRAFYAVGESLSALFADRVIADAGVIADYYRERFGIEPASIPYGADFPDEADSDVLQRLGVAPRGYILYVSRFESENNPLEVVLAYEKLVDAPPLVMLGEGLYAPDLVRELHRHRSARVLFPGALYGADYRTLQRNSRLYIQATEVGGTHPALVEAMGAGASVLAHDTPENREVGGDAIGYFQLRPQETLSAALAEALRDPGLRERRSVLARERATALYRWDSVADQYEKLFQALIS
jgi:glycosyltransferase involved in cell wall biosynthesis